MRLNKNIAVSETGFIFNPSTGDSFSTNPIGQDIIRLLKDNKTPKQIAKSITDKYSIDESTVEKDLNDFFQMMQSYQLLNEDEQ
jgi:hypothetical protein